MDPKSRDVGEELEADMTTSTQNNGTAKSTARDKATAPRASRVDGVSDRTGDAVESVRSAAETVRVAAAGAASRVPEVVASTRAAFDDANRRIQAGSDGSLTMGTAVTFGLAVGLLVGGAARPLVAFALIPAGMMGLTLLDRSSRRPAVGRVDATAGR